MERRRSRYKEMERNLTYAILGEAVVFLCYLISAGFGVTWLKVITAFVAIVGSALCLAYLKMTGELLKLRSRWLTFGFAAIVLCVLVSLLVNFPSPNPLNQVVPDATPSTASVLVPFLHF